MSFLSNMKDIEDDLRSRIEIARFEKKVANKQVQFHKQEATRFESMEIESGILIDRLNEQLKRHLNMYPEYVEEPREKDIREFKKRLPELLKKI